MKKLFTEFSIKNIKIEPITKRFFDRIEYNGRKYILLAVGNGKNLVSDMILKNIAYKDSNELFNNISNYINNFVGLQVFH